MRLGQSQQFRLSQQMKLAPRIIQAMEILQLPTLALVERIDQELQSNPVLELKGPVTGESGERADQDYPADRGERDLVVDDRNDHQEDFQRLAEFTAEFGPDVTGGERAPRPRRDVGERDRKMEAMANTPARGESLNEHLLEQWVFIDVEDDLKSAGQRLISEIDDDGYLRTSLEQVADDGDLPRSLDSLRRALPLVQALDPVGVGARDLQECLLLQLAAEAQAGQDVSLETELVNRFLRDIEMNRLPQIAQRTHRSVEDIKAALENISHLSPRPGSLVAERSAPVIHPDALVDLDDDGDVVVTMTDGQTPRLGISRGYQRMARDRATEREARQYLQKHVRSAQWLISAIQQRRETVRRVVVEVFRIQKEFLLQGREALRPLPMAEIAKAVGVHVATVSRAVAGKYVQTPRGIFPLRMFFSGGTTNAEGRDVAWDAVKAKLLEIVEAEDKAHPFNDDRLAAELEKHGLKIARRTVAKYRGLLNIPPARKRKQF